MAQEQTALVGEPIEVLVNVIGSAGTHEAATINTTTTRIDGYPSTAPTVTTVATGIYKISFSGVTPAPAEGDRLTVKINGTVTSTSTAWSEYGIPVKILAEERGTDNASTFDASSDTVTTDAASRTASQADVSALATAASIAALNDIAATDIVSGGAITTLNGAVANVDLVDVTTTNTDMRGTDNAILASSAPANWGSLSINSSGHIARVVLTDTTTINSDMVDISSLATASDLSVIDGVVDAIKLKTDQLTFTVSNQVDANALSGGSGGDDAATIYSYFTASNREDVFHADVSALSTSAEIAALNDISVNDVWDASLSNHNVGGSTGKALRQIKEGVISVDGSVNDTSATSTQFISSLSSSVDGYYHDKVIVFISGSLLGQARHIETYTGSTKSITVSQAFTSAPSNGDEFLILATHEHSLNEISEAVWSDTQSSYTVDGTFGYYLDSQVSSAGAGGSGLYQLTVNVTDASSGAALQGARINVDGTTLTLTTDSAGQCVFNLDSGVYLLTISPPAGYDTVSANTVTITTADTSSSFSLTETTSSGDCDVPWVG